MNERDQIVAKVKKAREIISRSEKAGVGLFIRGHQFDARRPELLTDRLRFQIESNLDAIMVELLIAKVDQAIHDLGVTSEDLSYYFNSEWTEHHDNPVKLRDMARAVQTLRSNDEFFDTEH